MLRRPRFLDCLWFRSKKQRSAARQDSLRRFTPRFDVLEERALPSVTPAHLYNLNGSLTDQFGGPALVADGGAFSAGRYAFGPNQGLRLTGALADTSNYSVAMVVNLSVLTPTFEKLIDFQARASDNGLYVAGSNLQLYPGVAGTGTVSANQDFQVVLTRDKVSGVTSVYLNGVLQQTYVGSDSSVAVPGTNVLTFFEDDFETGAVEAVAGNVDYIATFDRALTSAEVSQLGNVGQQVNSPPVITSLVSTNPTEALKSVNGQVTITGAFTDADTIDTHTVTVNWGDGSAAQTLKSLDEVHGRFSASHQYTKGGVFAVTVAIDDGHGGQDTKSTAAVVAGVGQVGNVLYVIGTDSNDDVRIDLRRAACRPKATPPPVLWVSAKFGAASTAGAAKREVNFSFDPATITKIVVLAGGGDDHVVVSRDVTISAFILGGAGNDRLRGGGGNDVVVGGDGNDRLSGGKGTNILVAGNGKDVFHGCKGTNLKVTGPAPNENDLNALAAALAAWLAGDKAGALAALGVR